MKILLLIAALTGSFLITSAQDTVVVVEKALKIAGMSPITEYYGFAEGDKMVLSLNMEKGELKDFIISEYPGNIKFEDHSIERIDKRTITIPRKGVYKFEYYNSFILPRTVNLKIQRIPRDATTRSFNTNIIWVDKIDTAYQAQDTYTITSDTTYEEVISTRVKLNSAANNDNTNKATLDFLLPAGTIKWAYWIGADKEGDKAFEEDSMQFVKSGIKLNGAVNPLAGFVWGLSSMTRTNENDNIQYYFITTNDETQKFARENPFKFFKKGNGPIDFALMNYANKNPQRYFLGLKNTNAAQSAEISVKLLAVLINSKYKAVTDNVPNYLNHKVPVNEE